MQFNNEDICEKLQSNERRLKISVLEGLQRYCEDSKTPINEINSIFDECYLHLLKCYSDRYESVRDQAVQTVSLFLLRLPPNDFHLVNVLSTLSERMGRQETVEESEEIRLLYVVQLHALVHQYVSTGNRCTLQQCRCCYSDIVKVLAKAIRDAYPAVQREACSCVVTLVQAADTFAFQPWCEQLAKPLYGMLNHKHSMARISAVQALARIALHSDASNDGGFSRLLMEVSPLLMDSMPLVRRECGQLGVLMLMELRDRYSYFDRIIPLVLCCLKDDSPEVVDYIRPLWVKCGKKYFDENETELSKQEIGDFPAENYPKGVQRPTIGCRGMVQRSLRLLKLITRESSDWKENVRLHSLKLLYQFVLHAEAAMTAKFFEIYPDVARACGDAEFAVANEAKKVADLMGRLFCYADWREHGLDGLARNAKEGYLKCFYYMFTASLGPDFADLLRVSRILIASEFSQTLKPDFQMYIIKLVETLLNKYEQLEQMSQSSKELSLEQLNLQNDSYEELKKNMYISTIKVMALSFETDQINVEELEEKGNRLCERLAMHLKVAELHERYFGFALDYVQNLDAPLDGLSEPILLLHGLLNIAKFRAPYLQQLQVKFNKVWENCTDEAKVKIYSGISITMLLWHETMNKDIEESAKLLRAFLMVVVEPHLHWRAGANAEAMRSLATATLCAVSQGAVNEATQVLPEFAKFMPSLIEDHATATRNYAIKCLYNFGEISVEELKPIAYATLQRLDDPSSSIRELAALAIPKLRPKLEKEKNEENYYDRDTWEVFIKKAVDMLFLHYEGPEVRLQKAIKGAINQLAEKYPDICKSSYNRAIVMSYNNKQLSELQNDLPILV